MFFEPLRFRRPDLQAEVRELLAVFRNSPAGSGIPLIEIVRILGVNLSPGFREQIQARGDLALHADRFDNHGPAIRRDVRLFGFEVHLIISEQISGRLSREGQGAQLCFDPGHSVSATKLIFRTELQQISLDPWMLRISFHGSQDVLVRLD
jgi:hypothetical protein